MWVPELTKKEGPLYRAIADVLGDDLAAGRLQPGMRLPTHRDLADRLGVTVGTVTRAYAEAARRGLISGEVGRGTFLRSRAEPYAFAHPGAEAPAIDLSLNLPPAADPSEHAAALQEALTSIAHDDVSGLLAYPAAGGHPSHREAGAEWIAEVGLEARPEDVLVCGGSQHALTTLFATLFKPGDLLVTEALTYPGMRSVASLLHLRLQGLPIDEHGLRPDGFETACRGGGVRGLYCVPTIQNPTAAVMPEERRAAIAAIAREHGVMIVEDDVHALVPPERPAPLAAFAPETSCYITSTSKTLVPGLRIAYVLAPQPLVARIAAGIRATTWGAAPLMAEVAARWIRSGTARTIVASRRREAAVRQRLAAEALGAFRVQTHPYAYYVWLQVPEPWRGEAFAAAARRRGVLVTPAEAFAVGRSAVPHAARICLGAARTREQLGQGLRLLVELLAEQPEADPPVV